MAGVAVHERDAWPLQNRLTQAVQRRLPRGFDPSDFELHAAEIMSPMRGSRSTPSVWVQLDYATRTGVLTEAYRVLSQFKPSDSGFPLALFGAVVEGRQREERAYEEVLHRFDEMLTRQSHNLGSRQVGLVVHDKRAIERDVQRAAQTWRHMAGRIGVLTHLADVPFFADSQASRLLQAADLTSWALWRCYGLPHGDERWIEMLWNMFDQVDGVMHGLIHASPRFQSGCPCRPCTSRRAE